MRGCWKYYAYALSDTINEHKPFLSKNIYCLFDIYIEGGIDYAVAFVVDMPLVLGHIPPYFLLNC